MKLVLFDRISEQRVAFHPLALSRPIFYLKSGMTTVGERVARTAQTSVEAAFVPDHLVGECRKGGLTRLNDPSILLEEDLLLVDATLRSESLERFLKEKKGVACDNRGGILAVHRTYCGKVEFDCTSLDAFLLSAEQMGKERKDALFFGNRFEGLWELIAANRENLISDFAHLSRSGLEGKIEHPFALRGSKKDVFVAPSACLHPMVVLDAENGPIYIEEGAVIHPFTRIEGPAYIGRDSILYGTKLRAGTTLGECCRMGGEIEESIIQGFSNKYHDGFLGHAYVGSWVNLGALTANSDLKNDYSHVSVLFNGRKSVSTGSTKVGAFIGDHVKTSIGTLLNTGAYVGAMSLIVASGSLLPKFIPSFTWYVGGRITEGKGKEAAFVTAKAACARRGVDWEQDRLVWEAIYEQTKEERTPLS